MAWSDKPQNEREQRLFDAGFPINNTYGIDRWGRCGHCHKMFKGASVWGPDFALDSDPPEAILETVKRGSTSTGWCFDCAERVIARLRKQPSRVDTTPVYDFERNPPEQGSWL